jgi:hypothetical protein
MEETCSFETSVDFQPTERRYIPEERTLHNHRCENLKSYVSIRLIILKKVRWTGHVQLTGYARNSACVKFWLERFEVRNCWKDKNVDVA